MTQLELPTGPRVGDPDGPWHIHAQRDRALVRRGFGRESLQETLAHLRCRGDAWAYVDTRAGGELIRTHMTLNLPDLRIGGAS